MRSSVARGTPMSLKPMWATPSSLTASTTSSASSIVRSWRVNMKMKSIGASGGVRPDAPASHYRMLAHKHCTWRVQDDVGTVRVGVRETEHVVEGPSTNRYR